MSTPASPPITGRPWARAGHLARRLPSRARAGIVALLHIIRHLLVRLLWLLRGWAGLIAGTLAVLALWLGPLAGACWIATHVTTFYHQAAAAVTLWYQTAYDAVAWPAANGVTALRATQAWARHGYHGFAPTIHTSTWAFWMRHGAAWRYATLHSPSGAPVRAAIPVELGSVLVFLALFGVFILIGRRKRALDPTRANTYGGARWQTWDELKRRRAKPGDMVLGTARRGFRRITIGVRSALLLEGVAIDAPTGLGKSNAFFKTQLLEPDPAVDYVATDNKGDGWNQTAAAMSRTHDVYRLDMQNPANSVTWAPLALVRTPAKAEDWARAWLHNSKPADSAPPQPYFEQAVLLLMAAGVMHVHAVAAADGRPSGTLDELLALLLQPNVEAIEKALKKGPSGAETGPAAQFLGLIAEHRDLRSSIPSGLAPRLSALADPAIKAVVGGQGTLDLDRLGRKERRPVALYIVIPAGDDTLRPLVAALFTTMFTVLLDRARTLPNGELAREVRMLLDEFGTMGAIPNAPKWFNICRQPRIARVISFQSFSQLVDDYGELGAKAIIDSCNVLGWLGGTRGDDAKWASDALGNRTVLAHGEGDSTAPGGLFGRRPDRGSQSVSETGVPLLFPDDLAASSRRRVVAIAREARPMDLRTRPMWSVRAMRRLMKRPAPRACVEAPAEPTPAPAAITSAREDAQVVAVPNAARGATPVGTPRAPARVLAKPIPATPPPAATAAVAVAPAASTPAAATDPAAIAPTSRPTRLPTAPVKHGTAYDWTGLP
jgi:type IV secretory pathway TraG/TraD family ATPase VirD4